MKTKHVLLATIIASFFLVTGCSEDDDNLQESEITSQGELLPKSASASRNSSVISNEYAQAQQEVLETFMAIGEIITNGAGKGYDSEFMDELISYHAYGPKFTEFNGGETFDGAGNEHNERQLFGEDIEEDGVLQFAAKEGTMKVAVYYGNVANLTFTSDFILKHKQYGQITVNNLITLLFVKTNGQWKLVHEHHSPVAVPL